MENLNWIEQEINKKKRYIEIQESNITKHLSYIENYESEIKEIETNK